MRIPALLLLALLAPLATSAWSTPADPLPEPSTPEDAPPYMWVEPNDADRHRVYFSVSLLPSANSAGSLFVAYLGYWRDCNDDGHVGYGQGGPETYSPALLLNPAICPVGSPYNTGAAVKEFLWISNGPGGDVVDPDAEAWVDWGRVAEAWPGTPKRFATDTLSYNPAVTTGPRWHGNAIKPANPYGPDPIKLTGFAMLGSASLQGPSAPGPVELPGGGARFAYGAEHCGSSVGTGAPVSATNWVCDPAQWLGAHAVGDVYLLRDTDCNEAAPGSGLC